MRGFKPRVPDRWIQTDEPRVGNEEVILVGILMRGYKPRVPVPVTESK
jgi:hypothetical protein